MLGASGGVCWELVDMCVLEASGGVYWELVEVCTGS